MEDTDKTEDFSDILARSFKKRKEMEESVRDEDMIEITFGEKLTPLTDEEKIRFEERVKEAKESGEEIFLPKFFADGRVEMVNYEDIKKGQDE